ncbi:MAG TPA: prepilin-type N-terminal cleavage/methylation domain-containing protein [Pyrinomonadaceae bacterium]|jgi:type IV pilus assembly protein PilA|nr:prepilin-type N-terminal cleavage/methylation domain-containing protein [Pyrinomonadaceae bacterium]
MKKNPTSQRGFSLIELLIVVAIIGIIAAIAVPYLEQAKQASKSASAVSSMRTIHSSESAYHSSTGQYGTLTELGNANYISDPGLAGGRKSDYTFSVTPLTTLNYEAVADPVLDPANAYQHYFIDGSGVLRVQIGAGATVASNPIQQ